MKFKFSRIHYFYLLILLLNPFLFNCASPSDNSKSSMIYLNSKDLNISKQDINYEMIKNPNSKNFDEQIRARIIGFAWVSI